FRRILSGFPSSVRTLFTTTKRTLLASQGLLRGAIETRVLYSIAVTISQERFQSYVNADSRMFASSWLVCSVRLCLTDNQSVPMPISPTHKIHGLGFALDRPMHLDLERFAYLSRN